MLTATAFIVISALTVWQLGAAMFLTGLSTAASGALYVLLPVDLAPSFPVFAVGYISAVALGLLPYRLVYNILPFAVSAVTLVLLHLASRRNQLEGG